MPLSPRASLVFAALAAACSGPSVGTDAGPGADAGAPGLDATAPPPDAGSVQPPALPFYEVPVDDPALAPHAFFAVPDVHYVTVGGTVTLTYDFPPDLSGIVDQEVVLSGPLDARGGATLSGALGTGTCEVRAGVGRCTEHFTALPLDPAAARALATSYAASADAVAARRAVIDRFASDPIGIVVFDVAVASEPTN